MLKKADVSLEIARTKKSEPLEEQRTVGSAKEDIRYLNVVQA